MYGHMGYLAKKRVKKLLITNTCLVQAILSEAFQTNNLLGFIFRAKQKYQFQFVQHLMALAQDTVALQQTS